MKRLHTELGLFPVSSPTSEHQCPCCGSNSSHVMMDYPAVSAQWASLSIEICNICGFGFVPEVPFDLAAYYANEYGADYQRNVLPPPQEFFQDVRSAKNWFAIRATKHADVINSITNKFASILEFGPGVGVLLSLLNADKKYAIELDKISQQYLGHLGVNLLIDAKEAGHPFDLIIASHFIEHLLVHEVKSFITGLNDLLTERGIVLVEVPEWGFVQHRSPPKKGGHEPHTLFFSTQSLALIFKNAGFETLYFQTAKRIFDVQGGQVDQTTYVDNKDFRRSGLFIVARKK